MDDHAAHIWSTSGTFQSPLSFVQVSKQALCFLSEAVEINAGLKGDFEQEDV